MEKLINRFQDWLGHKIEYLGLTEYFAEITSKAILFLLLAVFCLIVDRIIRDVMRNTGGKIAKRSKSNWDDLLIENKVFAAMAHLAPILLIDVFAPMIFDEESVFLAILLKLNTVALVLLSMIIINRFLNTVQAVLSEVEYLRSKPLGSYFQLVKIIIGGLLIILMISILADKSIMYFFGAFGAISAVLILVFKDTILGFIASIQLSANDMVRVGDWVEMPKYGADGDVIEINLTTIKVRNWDKTITTVPTYSFISDSFKNWRGMQETGARRISRSIFIDQHSVKFATPEMIERFKKIHLLKDFIPQKEKEIQEYNKEKNVDVSMVSNGRRMTNLGVFRNYLTFYLKNNPKINQDMFIMVRQLAPTEHGIPLQIYAFADTIAWAEYEPIQADIFDHTLAVIHQFELSIFQNPSGNDFRQLANNANPK